MELIIASQGLAAVNCDAACALAFVSCWVRAESAIMMDCDLACKLVSRKMVFPHELPVERRHGAKWAD